MTSRDNVFLYMLHKIILKIFNPLCRGSIAPGAWAQNVCPGPQYHAYEISEYPYRFLFLCPFQLTSRIFSTQGNPSRQGVHHPQLSLAKNFSRLWMKATGQVLSSRMMRVPVPSLLPTGTSEVKSRGISICSSTMKSVDAPPGKRSPEFIPIHHAAGMFSMISRMVVPKRQFPDTRDSSPCRLPHIISCRPARSG
jgi:hypothetical protein